MASIPLSSWDNNHPYTVADLLQTYERTYLPQLAPTTQIHHRVVFRSLCRQYGGLPLTAITPAWLRQWRGGGDAPRSPGGAGARLWALLGRPHRPRGGG